LQLAVVLVLALCADAIYWPTRPLGAFSHPFSNYALASLAHDLLPAMAIIKLLPKMLPSFQPADTSAMSRSTRSK
jgi:hypothetical protein